MKNFRDHALIAVFLPLAIAVNLMAAYKLPANLIAGAALVFLALNGVYYLAVIADRLTDIRDELQKGKTDDDR